jgi:NAD(P)-dependent dehydrogenase (short-subunit alcohol dehydrogenase family)
LLFKGQVVLVTGGATGLGKAIAMAFAAKGASVAIADVNETALGETLKEVCHLSPHSCGIVEDISVPGAGEKVIGHSVKELGGLHVLVNNAGAWSVERFLEITEQEWDKVFAINVKGLLFCLTAAARHMKEHGGGKIINITSPASKMALPNYLAYAASKAAVDSISRSAAVALGKFNITVNTIAPGRMDTAMQRMTEERFAAIEGMDVRSFVAGRTSNLPLQRRTTPEEIGEVATWLAGEQASYMTGSRLNISGGLELD